MQSFRDVVADGLQQRADVLVSNDMETNTVGEDGEDIRHSSLHIYIFTVICAVIV